jgi:hypothetical protein
MMGKYEVTLPVAGHVRAIVEAEDEESAIEAAMEVAFDHRDVDWEVLEAFNQGNVCFCPQPWEAEAERLDSPEDDDGEDGE